MPYTTDGRNNMLNGLGITHASLHSAFPGMAGANEIVGGAPAYARKAIAFGAPAGDQRAQGAAITFDVPAGAGVQFVGFWDAAVAGKCIGYHPLGGYAARKFIVDIAADLLRCPAHGLADGQMIVITGDTAPGGMVEGTIYYVRSATADTLQIAAISGGVAIDLTTQAGSAAQLARIIPEQYGAQATLTVSAANLGMRF